MTPELTLDGRGPVRLMEKCQETSWEMEQLLQKYRKKKRTCHVGSNEALPNWNIRWELVIFER